MSAPIWINHIAYLPAFESEKLAADLATWQRSLKESWASAVALAAELADLRGRLATQCGDTMVAQQRIATLEAALRDVLSQRPQGEAALTSVVAATSKVVRGSPQGIATESPASYSVIIDPRLSKPITRLRECWACGVSLDYDEHPQLCSECGATEPMGDGPQRYWPCGHHVVHVEDEICRWCSP